MFVLPSETKGTPKTLEGGIFAFNFSSVYYRPLLLKGSTIIRFMKHSTNCENE